jgi:hypothetical protein
MALPDPASALLLVDLVEEALFKACPACAGVEMFGIAAEEIMASAQHPMPARDSSYPERIGRSVRPICLAGCIDYSVSATVARPTPQPTSVRFILLHDLF